MSPRTSRRAILAAAGALAVRPRRAAGAEVPSVLDHVLLGCDDLDKGISFVENHLGVRAPFGGVHPGRGSRNALLSLGERRYLEIIAPDPAQPRSADYRGLYRIASPRLIGWAAHVDDIEELTRQLGKAGIAFDPPKPGERKRPTGQTLRWKALTLHDDRGGLLPFFIEWSKDSPHPSTDAPGGCRLERFQLAATQPDELKRVTSELHLDVAVVSAPQPALRAVFKGPKGSLSMPT